VGNVAIHNIRLEFGAPGRKVVALEDVSLTVPDKQFAVIVGPSGCGKSSLLDIVAGLRQPTAGRCLVDGVAVSKPGRQRGMVFQNYSLFPWLSVQKNVEFGLRLRNVPVKQREDTARSYLESVGLAGFENSHPSQLSGGMKQRVAIARALANDPDVLLMDEPFGALDSQTRTVMQQLLLKVWEKDSKTVIFVTHDIEEALFLGDIIYVMSARPGRFVDRITVPLPRPRRYELFSTPEFLKLKGRIHQRLHPESSSEDAHEEDLLPA
jgi:NitT/TauT family transport system ATP-binding protein